MVIAVSVPYRGATFLNSRTRKHRVRNYCFRPLSGSYISQFKKGIWKHIRKEFPSPIGELHFSIVSGVSPNGTRGECFRPLSGSYISQYWMISRGIGSVESFRPLSGSYISQFCLKTVVCCFFRFRPLSGSYISQSDSSNCNFYGFSVSVPYRGATFLNRIRSPDLFLTSVSVPYRGATFLNRFFDCSHKSQDVSVPYRGATFLNERVKKSQVWQFRFRPLSGSYISQYRGPGFWCCLRWFPSPIGELHFSIAKRIAFRRARRSFRPLSGSYISQ